jgi:hypothetical protein
LLPETADTVESVLFCENGDALLPLTVCFNAAPQARASDVYEVGAPHVWPWPMPVTSRQESMGLFSDMFGVGEDLWRLVRCVDWVEVEALLLRGRDFLE